MVKIRDNAEPEVIPKERDPFEFVLLALCIVLGMILIPMFYSAAFDNITERTLTQAVQTSPADRDPRDMTAVARTGFAIDAELALDMPLESKKRSLLCLKMSDGEIQSRFLNRAEETAALSISDPITSDDLGDEIDAYCREVLDIHGA